MPAPGEPQRQPTPAKPERLHRKAARNVRGLIVGAMLGALIGVLLGRLIGQPALGLVLGAIIGSAALYRVHPGNRQNPPGT